MNLRIAGLLLLTGCGSTAATSSDAGPGDTGVIDVADVQPVADTGTDVPGDLGAVDTGTDAGAVDSGVDVVTPPTDTGVDVATAPTDAGADVPGDNPCPLAAYPDFCSNGMGGGACANFQVSPTSCGACGVHCLSYQYCDGGTCH